MKLVCVFIFLLFPKNVLADKLSDSEVVNTQLSALKQSLTSSNVTLFRQLFDGNKVKLGSVFQPDFMYPNNVFALMGDGEFKNSLRIFTSFQPTLTAKGSLRALISIKYKLDGRDHKLDKEVVLSKSDNSPTGYLFTGFQDV